MSGTGWRAVCISEGPSCHPDYPALRPPGSALHLHSKTGQVAEGRTSVPHNGKTESLSWSIEWKTDLFRCLSVHVSVWTASSVWIIELNIVEEWRAPTQSKKMRPARNTCCCMIVGNDTKAGIKSVLNYRQTFGRLLPHSTCHKKHSPGSASWVWEGNVPGRIPTNFSHCCVSH